MHTGHAGSIRRLLMAGIAAWESTTSHRFCRTVASAAAIMSYVIIVVQKP